MFRGNIWRSTAAISPMQLESGARVGVIGGGPAGSFFSCFFLDNAQRLDLNIVLDIYEPRDFTSPGPAGCNMCGGIVSESLVQCLAAEGIRLPAGVVQRGIDSYVLHMDVGDARIDTPLHEKRIAAVHRGAGPRGIQVPLKSGLDAYLLGLARGKGANVIRGRVETVSLCEGYPVIKTKDQEQRYDLVVSAVGVNSPALKAFENLGLLYRPPISTKTYICEFWLGREAIQTYLGSSMHVFLLKIPRLEFAAVIPKGDYVTFCLLGNDVDKALVESFLDSNEVRQCMPPGWSVPKDFCHCSPKISIAAARHPFADRLLFVGDCGSTRLYKDGIGAAYRTAKAAAITAVFDGVSAQDFRRGFWPTCSRINWDNAVGKLVFAATRVIQSSRSLRRGVWRMVSQEQVSRHRKPRMSLALWDLFTGSAPYTEVLLGTLHPAFWARFLREIVAGARRSRPGSGDSDAGQHGQSVSRPGIHRAAG
jgi:flavin-dependent dehydrogenase